MKYLMQQCSVHGCHAPNQLQLLLRVGKADTVLEPLPARLDEQGLEISSPRAANDDSSSTRTTLLSLSGPGFIKPGWRKSNGLAAEK
jgi:hypothetical protein